ncbi:GntR family transcriptional regulator [Streptomyces sp. NPDC088752]|uniref:GntR family transcriptional regulator n=1 Tax=Streptomyces sp. NPDC088752 TaxID=3154963 RepID=UPI00344949C2
MTGSRTKEGLEESARQARHILLRDMLIRDLRKLVRRYQFDKPLPTLSEISVALGVGERPLREALRILDLDGEIVFRARGRARTFRLRPEDSHPEDTVLLQTIRESIRTGRFLPGQPLPTGLLSARHRASSHQIQRVCRRLMRERLVLLDNDGPAGPGYYVRKAEPQPFAIGMNPPSSQATDLPTATSGIAGRRRPGA